VLVTAAVLVVALLTDDSPADALLTDEEATNQKVGSACNVVEAVLAATDWYTAAGVLVAAELEDVASSEV